jgi:alginate O-acetyltransferase complex protein AlgI
MAFNTPVFSLFFAFAVMAIGFGPALAKRFRRGFGRGFSEHAYPQARVAIFLFLSLAFYVFSQVRFLGLFLVLSGLGYFFSKSIILSKNQRRKKIWLVLHLITMIGTLIFFKVVVESGQVETAGALSSWVLPLGLSFYTFQSLGYSFDAYRGLVTDPLPFSVYVTSLGFFLSIGAGPIPKMTELAEDLARPRIFTDAELKLAVFLICNGLFKKAVGDLLSFPANAYFSDLQPRSALAAWTGLLALSGQYYADFSGYTDIALGCAVLLGVKLPENFRLPYLAISFADHWRRWHISLSNWFRDYVFMPLILTGYPKVRRRFLFLTPTRFTALSLVATMALIGLWHGLTIHFFFWGVYNGIFVALSPAILRSLRKLGLGATPVLIAITFYLTAIGRILTVNHPARSLLALLRELHSPFLTSTALPATAVMTFFLVCLGLIAPHAFDYLRIEKPQHLDQPLVFWPLATGLLIFTFVFGTAGHAFLYFQF